MTVDFVDAVRGVTVPVRLATPQVCATCHGSGARPGHLAAHVSGLRRRRSGVHVAGRVRVRRAVSQLSRSRCGHRRPVPDVRRLWARSRRQDAVHPHPGRRRATASGSGSPVAASRARTAARPVTSTCVVHVRPHPVFGRRGDNLTLKLPVTFPEAALGATVAVPTLDGETVTVRIPPGTTSGRTLRVKGKGVHRKTAAPATCSSPSRSRSRASSTRHCARRARGLSRRRRGDRRADPRAHLYAETGGAQ